MIDESVISAIRAHDRRILQGPPAATAALAPALERELPKLDPDSRMIASMYLARFNGPGAGAVLLSMSADANEQVAASAAKSLVSVADKPPGDTILEAVRSRRAPAVRGYLYLAAGNAKNPPGLSSFRSNAKAETDPDAGINAQVAMVKLGGDVERKAFFERIQRAGPDDAIKIQEQMVYVGDKKLAKALLPWLAKKDEVFRLGSDRQPEMARMCDMAVWIAHLLDVSFQPQPDHLRNFGPDVLAAVKAALLALPD